MRSFNVVLEALIKIASWIPLANYIMKYLLKIRVTVAPDVFQRCGKLKFFTNNYIFIFY